MNKLLTIATVVAIISINQSFSNEFNARTVDGYNISCVRDIVEGRGKLMIVHCAEHDNQGSGMPLVAKNGGQIVINRTHGPDHVYHVESSLIKVEGSKIIQQQVLDPMFDSKDNILLKTENLVIYSQIINPNTSILSIEGDTKIEAIPEQVKTSDGQNQEVIRFINEGNIDFSKLDQRPVETTWGNQTKTVKYVEIKDNEKDVEYPVVTNEEGQNIVMLSECECLMTEDGIPLTMKDEKIKTKVITEYVQKVSACEASKSNATIKGGVISIGTARENLHGIKLLNPTKILFSEDTFIRKNTETKLEIQRSVPAKIEIPNVFVTLFSGSLNKIEATEFFAKKFYKDGESDLVNMGNENSVKINQSGSTALFKYPIKAFASEDACNIRLVAIQCDATGKIADKSFGSNWSSIESQRLTLFKDVQNCTNWENIGKSFNRKSLDLRPTLNELLNGKIEAEFMQFDGADWIKTSGPRGMSAFVSINQTFQNIPNFLSFDIKEVGRNYEITVFAMENEVRSFIIGQLTSQINSNTDAIKVPLSYLQKTTSQNVLKGENAEEIHYNSVSQKNPAFTTLNDENQTCLKEIETETELLNIGTLTIFNPSVVTANLKLQYKNIIEELTGQLPTPDEDKNSIMNIVQNNAFDIKFDTDNPFFTKDATETSKSLHMTLESDVLIYYSFIGSKPLKFSSSGNGHIAFIGNNTEFKGAVEFDSSVKRVDFLGIPVQVKEGAGAQKVNIDSYSADDTYSATLIGALAGSPSIFKEYRASDDVELFDLNTLGQSFRVSKNDDTVQISYGKKLPNSTNK